jgi:hypothetical protein
VTIAPGVAPKINSVWRVFERHDDGSTTYEHEEVFEGDRVQTCRMTVLPDRTVRHESLIIGLCGVCERGLLYGTGERCDRRRCAVGDHPRPDVGPPTTPPPGAHRYVPRGVQGGFRHDPGPEESCGVCHPVCGNCGLPPSAHIEEGDGLVCAVQDAVEDAGIVDPDRVMPPPRDEVEAPAPVLEPTAPAPVVEPPLVPEAASEPVYSTLDPVSDPSTPEHREWLRWLGR